MSSFSYESEEQRLYLLYKTDNEETINEEKVKNFTEKKREGIVKTEYIIDSNGNYFKYDVSSMTTLKQLLLDGVDEEGYCNILQSVVSTIAKLVEDKVGTRELVLNEELIYYNLVDKTVNFIAIPTSYFSCDLAPNQIIYEFSKLIISRMEVTGNLILEVNDYLENKVFNFLEFNSLINSAIMNNSEINNIIMNTNENNNVNIIKEEYIKEIDKSDNLVSEEKLLSEMAVNQLEEAPQQLYDDVVKSESQGVSSGVNNVKEITNNAKKIFFDKVSNIKVALENIKNNKPNKEAGIYNIVNMPVGNTTYEEAIRSEVAQQKENDKKRMEDIKNNFDNNRIFNNQIDKGEDGEGQNKTVIIDCVDGSVTDGNCVNTSNPYLLRKSTGEKIYINTNNFKIGRGRKFVDYYVGGNDTISKVHAYITTDAKYYYIVDNSSRNHTFVDGTMLEPIKQTALKHKSKIRLAREEFEFYLY